MTLYWGLNSIPELQGLPKAQQKRLWRIGWRAGAQKPRVWGGYLLMQLCIMIGIMVPSLLRGFPDGVLPALLWGGSWGGLGGVLSMQIVIHAVRPVLAMHRQAMEAKPAKDGSYYVPPAI